MNKSESIKNIAAALLEAQAQMTAALKTQKNPYFKSKYADLSSVIDAVKEHLNSNGITFVQGFDDYDGGIALETMLLHESGEWLSSTIKIPASKNDAQAYGSACTYARRYGLQSMCGLPAEDDDGNAASRGAINPTSGVWESVSDEDKKMLEDIASHVKVLLSEGDVKLAVDFIAGKELDADRKVALWTRFDSKERRKMKDSMQVKGD